MSRQDNSESNYHWFEEKLPELVKKYDGRYVVVKDSVILSDYGTFEEAFTETIKTETPGTFIIQLCSEDKTKTVQTYYTMRVKFA